MGAGSDPHNRSGSNVREFDLESQSVEDLVGLVLQFKLVGVLVKLEHLMDLGDNIEVLLLFGSLFELSGVGIGDDIAGGEVLGSILLESTSNGAVLSLLGGLHAGESIWTIWDGLTEWGQLV